MSASVSPAHQIPFALDSCLEPGQLRAVLSRTGRIHIPGVLTDDSARELYEFLAQSMEWTLVLNSGEKVYDLNREVRTTLGAAKERELMEHVYSRARTDFQYCYESCRVPEDARERARLPTPLTRFADFINSDVFLSFARELTGRPDINFADAQATRYSAGHFLSLHDDDVRVKRRVAAYVLNLTPKWHPDWGGQLQFIGKDGHVSEGLVPTFNALNLFLVPQPHLVSLVTPFAVGARYSVTGWLRAV